jgi:hypothetical protein
MRRSACSAPKPPSPARTWLLRSHPTGGDDAPTHLSGRAAFEAGGTRSCDGRPDDRGGTTARIRAWTPPVRRGRARPVDRPPPVARRRRRRRRGPRTAGVRPRRRLPQDRARPQPCRSLAPARPEVNAGPETPCQNPPRHQDAAQRRNAALERSSSDGAATAVHSGTTGVRREVTQPHGTGQQLRLEAIGRGPAVARAAARAPRGARGLRGRRGHGVRHRRLRCGPMTC